MNLAFAVLAAVLIVGGNAFAQIGMSFEEAAKLPNRIGLETYKQYGEDFVKLTTEDDKGLVLEMDFLNYQCESARWVLREGKLPDDFAKEVWKANFQNEEFVKKGDDTWLGKTGAMLTQAKTKSGKEVIWVRSAKMEKVMYAEAVRSVERKTGAKIDQEALEKVKAIDQKRNSTKEQPRQQQVYNEKGDWVGTIRNGQIYSTDSTWSGRVNSTGQIFNANGEWSGRVNSTGQIYDTESDWKGTAR